VRERCKRFSGPSARRVSGGTCVTQTRVIGRDLERMFAVLVLLTVLLSGENRTDNLILAHERPDSERIVGYSEGNSDLAVQELGSTSLPSRYVRGVSNIGYT
jgi:hypothetical protein